MEQLKVANNGQWELAKSAKQYIAYVAPHNTYHPGHPELGSNLNWDHDAFYGGANKHTHDPVGAFKFNSPEEAKNHLEAIHSMGKNPIPASAYTITTHDKSIER